VELATFIYNLKANIGFHSWASAVITFAGLMALIKLFKGLVLIKISKAVKRTKTRLDDLFVDALNGFGWPFYFFLSLYISIQFLNLPILAEKTIGFLLLINVTYYVIKGSHKFVDFGIDEYVHRKKDADDSGVRMIGKLIKALLWLFAFIFILSNLGYNVSTLIAGLGIGGIAIAFALQNILSDIFASFSIYFDKPFEVGDFIIIDEDMGIVKKIGIKSTRIETLKGQELVVSNKILTETRINNYKKMKKRRIVFGFGVVYETTTAKLKKIPKLVENVLKGIKIVKLDRVNFREFGDSALTYQVVYYIDSSVYKKYVEVQEQINLGIKQAFEKARIEMAYPTQTLYVKKLKK